MRVIDGTTIKINRGDILPLRLTIPISQNENYIFQVGDTIIFGVYGAKKMSQNALLLKEVVVTEQSDHVDITLTSEEMKIGDLIDKPTDYWYEIELNGQQTVIGYDDNGAKILRLYPEGSEVI